VNGLASYHRQLPHTMHSMYATPHEHSIKMHVRLGARLPRTMHIQHSVKMHVLLGATVGNAYGLPDEQVNGISRTVDDMSRRKRAVACAG
jgi:hypothetical protein